MQVDHEWEERRPGLSSLCNNCHTRLPRALAQPCHSNRLNWRVAVSPVWLQATERERNDAQTVASTSNVPQRWETVFVVIFESRTTFILQLRVTSSPVIQMSRGQRRRGVVFQRDSQPATRHTISVSREERRRDLSIEFHTVRRRGDGTRLLNHWQDLSRRIFCPVSTYPWVVFWQVKIIVSIFPSDGFMSSLGCQEKARVGHLYRGRDCENNQMEERFERKCYCRYKGGGG